MVHGKYYTLNPTNFFIYFANNLGAKSATRRLPALGVHYAQFSLHRCRARTVRCTRVLPIIPLNRVPSGMIIKVRVVTRATNRAINSNVRCTFGSLPVRPSRSPRRCLFGTRRSARAFILVRISRGDTYRKVAR